ncbi:hypothetical protein ACFL27_24995 [candidate division CSSED10-310 bacterium]|uniref:Uncharacterized protein n=1 Tax=candidate division CSSED10-310 bacterium TaxID=2855610 RepID=A0ABV6Z4U2_UNCC1
MKKIKILFAMTLLLNCAPVVRANDGLDRYGGRYLFYHLYQPISENAGFTVLEEDMKGGADGAPAYRWGRPEFLAIVKLIAAEVNTTQGKAQHQMPIFDLSAENGDTPIDWEDKEYPTGRHPGNSHDGGNNFDLGYYMTSLKGPHIDPDYAVCDDHYSKTEQDEEGKPKDLYQCFGPVIRLDVERQAYFFLRLFQWHADRFDHLLLEAIGVDHYVKKAVLDRISSWREQGTYNVTPEIIAEMEKIMTCDRWGGWARFHHHHTHVRFREIDEGGPFRNELYKLFDQERALEWQLWHDKFVDKTVFIKADLLSYKLGRAIDVTILKPKNLLVESCEYKLGSEDWVTAEEPENNFRYVFDLPYKPQPRDKKLRIQAKIQLSEGTSINLSQVVHLPALSPVLRVGVYKSAICGNYKKEVIEGKELWQLTVSFPPVYNIYITKVAYQIFFMDDTIEPVVVNGKGDQFEATFDNDKKKGILSIEATVYVSKRIRHTIPIYVTL